MGIHHHGLSRNHHHHHHRQIDTAAAHQTNTGSRQRRGRRRRRGQLEGKKMLSVKNNFVVERNVMLMHRGPTYAPSYPLLKEDKDEMRRLKAVAQAQKRGEIQKKMELRKMEKEKFDAEEEEEARPVLVDEICHVCATCAKVTERDFKSRDGAKCFCSYTCKLKGERPQMSLGRRSQEDMQQAVHMKK